MPYCTTCGSEVSGEMRFCHQCGIELRILKAGFKVDKASDLDDQVEEPAYTATTRIRKGRLYRQWITHAGLPSDAAAQRRTSRNTPKSVEKSVEGNSRNFAVLHVLLGVCVGALVTALAFLLV
jgi:hypothetical protein